MANDYLSLLKMKKQDQNARSGDDPMKLMNSQMGIAKANYEVGEKKPTKGDDYIDMAQMLRKQIGDGPQRGYKALIAGMLNGLELGGRSKARDEKLENANKFYNVMSSLEANTNAMQQRIQQTEKRRQVEEQLTPELMALTNFSNKIPYDEFAKQSNSLVDRYNQAMGTNYKVNMIDQQSGKILLSDPSSGNQVVDLYSMFPDLRQKQQLSTLEQKAMQQAEMNNQTELDQLRNQSLQAKTGARNADTYEKQVNQSVRKLGREEAKEVSEIYNKKIKPAEHFIQGADTILEIIDRNPDILQSVQAIPWQSTEPGYIDQALRKLSKSLDPETAKDLGVISKIIAQMNLDQVADINAKPNMFLERLVVKGGVSQNLAPEAVREILTREKKNKIKVIADSENQIDFIGRGDPQGYSDSILDRKNKMPPDTDGKPSPAIDLREGEVMLIDAKTGKMTAIPERSVDAAIASGDFRVPENQ